MGAAHIGYLKSTTGHTKKINKANSMAQIKIFIDPMHSPVACFDFGSDFQDLDARMA